MLSQAFSSGSGCGSCSGDLADVDLSVGDDIPPSVAARVTSLEAQVAALQTALSALI